ncbi:hypothetical protein ACFV1W_03730 [Kitasatospora sp. NPDC059648]
MASTVAYAVNPPADGGPYTVITIAMPHRTGVPVPRRWTKGADNH